MTPVEHGPDDNADHDLTSIYGEIDALLDGEPVDRTILRTMLDEPAARDYLVDALALRQLARDMGPGQFVASRATRGSGGLMTRTMQWVAAAVILVFGAGAGYLYGHRATAMSEASGSLEVVVESPAAAAPPAPEPTRSIRFEPGVNWTTQK
jgi:hypothetical protein